MSENRTRGVQFGAPPVNAVPSGTGVEPPVPEWVDVSQTLERWFAFIDVCGFTTFTERNGTPAALEVLTRFRSAIRAVTARRGVRVLKWLGDGAMLVGVEAGPVIAAVCELGLRFADDDFDVHAGIAGGHVLLFEGDDYIGSAVNMAARLCDYAENFDVLMPTMHLERLPEGVEAEPYGEIELHGFPGTIDVVRLTGAPTELQRHDTGELWTRPPVA